MMKENDHTFCPTPCNSEALKSGSPIAIKQWQGESLVLWLMKIMIKSVARSQGSVREFGGERIGVCSLMSNLASEQDVPLKS